MDRCTDVFCEKFIDYAVALSFATVRTGGINGHVILGVRFRVSFQKVTNHGIHGEATITEDVIGGNRASTGGTECCRDVCHFV